MYKKHISIFLLAILLFGTFSGCIDQNNNDGTNEEITATVTIDFGNGTIDTYEVKTKNNTVYDFLIQAAKKAGYDVKATYYGLYDSMFIDSIANVENGQDNKYWIYYINGESGSVGSQKQTVENNDVIEWKFETYT